MSDLEIGILSVAGVLVLVYIGVHIGVALSLLSFGCVWLIRDDMAIAGKLLALAAAESLQRYEFGVIPLFVLMGLFVSISDIGRDTYDVMNHVFRRVRAGLGTATVAANAVFAAVTGTSIASASVFTKVAVPEMLRLGYKPRFAVGVVAGSSVLGMLIPPSLLLILFGILAETSIGDLFIAGIVPGVLLAAAYAGLIWIMARYWPDYVQPGMAERMERAKTESLLTPYQVFTKGTPIILLIVIVLGGIYGGVFTATEAGGVGALGALILTVLRRKLTLTSFWHVLVETGHVTAAISFLLISANIYSRMVTLTGIPNEMEVGDQQPRARVLRHHRDLPGGDRGAGHDPGFGLDHADHRADHRAGAGQFRRRPDLARDHHDHRRRDRAAHAAARHRVLRDSKQLARHGDHAERHLRRRGAVRADDGARAGAGDGVPRDRARPGEVRATGHRLRLSGAFDSK